MALWPAHNARCLYQNAIPAIPLDPDHLCDLSTFFNQHRHKTRKDNRSAENGKKRALTDAVSVCLVRHGDFHRLFPVHQNKTAQSRISPVGPRFPHRRHWKMPILASQSGQNPLTGENLRSGTRINCAPEQRFGNFCPVTVPGNASLSEPAASRL